MKIWKEMQNIENGVIKGCWRSLKVIEIVPFDRTHMMSY